MPTRQPGQPQQFSSTRLTKTSERTPEFVPCTLRRWTGRYARIPGNTSTFHVRRCDRAWQAVVEWKDGYDAATCTMVPGAAARALAAAVCVAKQRAGSGSGGSFQINEFGQVLVPVSDEAERCMLVGEWHGPLRFANAFEPGRTFDLTSAAGLSVGDPWPMPYVGIPHKLCADGGIAFSRVGTLALRPPRQDPRLIDALTRIRGDGGCRFIVAPGGIVLTKAQPTRRSRDSDDEANWQPVYAGRVDFTRWFAKEA